MRIQAWARRRARAAGLALAIPAAIAARGAPPYSWAQPHARAIETGDLEWAPAPFRFEAGAEVRYIDFEAGDDARDGRAPATAWKHHPWDSAARGVAARERGIRTYVFKRGVVYRGALTAAESGAPGDPIRLTSDPAWGEGEAAIHGSVALRGGWRRGAARADIPEPDRVWWRDLDFLPRNAWWIEPDGAIRRLPLARDPNWTVSDPDDVKREWRVWNYPAGPGFGVYTQAPDGRRLYLGIDTVNITRPRAFYEGAIVWTEYGWVMGTPYPARVEVVDLERRGLGFGGQFGGVGHYVLVRGCRYYLEDKPHYLDDPEGEFWFERRGDGGRFYLRPPGGRDPNTAVVEAARHGTLLDSRGMSHVAISGLTFRFTNFPWDLTQLGYRGSGRNLVPREELSPAAIRLLGAGADIRVTHCRFEHLYQAVYLRPPERGHEIDGVVVADNDIRYTDGGGICLTDGAIFADVDPRAGRLLDAQVLRNRLHEVGRRPSRYGQGAAIDVANARTVEIAGNVVTRAWGLGINAVGGKRSGAAWDVPLSRVLIHHNKVVDPLLNNNDFGGIETWQGGPFYVYNNVVGNPGGFQNFRAALRSGRAIYHRFGFAYYLDGAFKNYHFNNIGWGASSDPASPRGNRAAVQEIHSFQNTFFNNTFYNFVKGSRRQAPQGGRNKYLGNVWDTIGDWVFRHADPARTEAAGNEADAGPPAERFALETNAYAHNVFHAVARFGVFKPSGQWHATFDDARQALRSARAIEWEMGVLAERPPLRDAAGHDFRPAPGGAAAGRGVRVFVPWALARTVGEWNFYPAGDDPANLLDEHWYQRPYYTNRARYAELPRFPLRGVNIGAGDFVEGPLENWTRGALRLNGRDQYAVAPDAAMNGPLEYVVEYRGASGDSERETRVAAGEDFASPQVHRGSFLIELYFRTAPGAADAALVEKRDDDAGYALALDGAGRLAFSVRGDDGTAAAVVAPRPVNDGTWRHVIAECDRAARTLTIFVDGEAAARAPGPGPEASLANAGDLYVGGTPRGRCLAGTLEFLRIALGSLADARTTIEELRAWQFDGPHLRDFTGRRPAGARDAGALHGGAFAD